MSIETCFHIPDPELLYTVLLWVFHFHDVHHHPSEISKEQQLQKTKSHLYRIIISQLVKRQIDTQAAHLAESIKVEKEKGSDSTHGRQSIHPKQDSEVTLHPNRSKTIVALHIYTPWHVMESVLMSMNHTHSYRWTSYKGTKPVLPSMALTTPETELKIWLLHVLLVNTNQFWT